MAAAMVSYVGTFVQDVAERWLILDLTGTPMPAAMITTAFVGGSFIAMLPSGVLADRVDRQRIIVWGQLAQATVATVVGLLTLLHHVTPAVLIVGAAALGLGMGISAPAWSALLTEILPKDQVADGVTTNGIVFNLARALGPAIGGVVLSLLGAAVSFFVNAATFIVVLVAVLTRELDDRPPPSRAPPPLLRAFTEPFVYAVRVIEIRAIILAMLAFTAGAASFYALSPAFAKLTLEAAPQTYGLMVGATGAGSVAGGLALRRAREHFAPRTLLAANMVLYGISSLAVSRAGAPWAAILFSLPAGFGWIATFSSCAALLQLQAPNRLRARMVAIYTMAHFVMFGIGASIAGAIAESRSVRDAIAAGGILCIAAGLFTLRLRLPATFTNAS